MVFIETPVFTRLLKDTLSDEDYGALQQTLVERPEAGDLIKGGGGIRKVRWALPGRGKSGGIRVLYLAREGRRDLPALLVCERRAIGSHSRTGQVTGEVGEGIEVKKATFAELLKSVEQAAAIARGERAPSRAFTVNASTIKKLRNQTRLSQPGFAELLGVEVSTLRNWEQGRREPTGPAKALLRAIRNDPEHVLKALIRAA